MLFTSIDEINSIYPTSRWDDIESLLNPLQKVERTKLTKYLGAPLLRRLNSDYRLLLDTQGGILVQHTDDEDLSPVSVLTDSVGEPTPAPVPSAVLGATSAPVSEASASAPYSLTIDLLRSCQETILYMMLSDNIRILSSSFNRGGGFNTMIADDYEQSSDKQLDSLKRETWHNAMSSVENILLLLEQDAKESHIYTDLWKQSHYYYQHSDLLFTTADDLNHYLDIQDSREQYISLTPVIRNCQDNYLAGRIGDDLLSDLISGSVLVGSAYESTYETIRPRIYKHLKQALANYISASHEYITLRNYKDNTIKQANQASDRAHGNGDMQLALASRLIVTNPSVFSHYIQSSPTLQSIYQTETGTTWTTPVPEGSPSGTTSPTVSSASADASTTTDLSSRSYSSLADFGGLHLN